MKKFEEYLIKKEYINKELNNCLFTKSDKIFVGWMFNFLKETYNYTYNDFTKPIKELFDIFYNEILRMEKTI
jgi:hypothetical protein